MDGREALKRLADGEHVFMELINETVKLKLAEDGLQWDVAGCENQVTYWTFNQIYTSKGLYIPKPFDVRQAMRDRPNEWVGAFKDRKGEWHKVGFDTESFMAIETSYDSTVKCEFYAYNVRQATEEEMYACIPIEDVPEKSKLYGMKPSIAICDEEATR